MQIRAYTRSWIGMGGGGGGFDIIRIPGAKRIFVKLKRKRRLPAPVYTCII